MEKLTLHYPFFCIKFNPMKYQIQTARFFPHLEQNFASWLRTCPHFGHTLVMGLFRGAPCCGLSLIIRYRSSPSTLRKNTIIAQSPPFIPRDSASRYTHTSNKMATTNQNNNGIKKTPVVNNYVILPEFSYFAISLK